MTYGGLTCIIDLAEKALGTELSLGYIGNCSSYPDPSKPRFYPGNYDDRSWSIQFTAFRDYSDRHHYAPHNLVLGATDEWKAMTQMELYNRLVTKFRQLRDAAVAA